MTGVMLAVLGVAAAAIPSTPDPAAAAPGAPPVPERYAGQQIDWKPCFAREGATLPPVMPSGSEVLECGSFAVPRDWDRPDAGVDLTIAVSRLRPPGGEAPRGSLFTNPGGPGAPGTFVPLLFLITRRTDLLANFEVIGIDVRGTGESTNVTCALQAETGASLDPRDRDPGNTDLILDATEYVANACQQSAGDLGPFITTRQTVADLDLLRALLGREKVSYVGYSGGTWIGAHYATYFPDRVDRFVLDANAEFTAPWQTVFSRQSLGFQRRLDVDFLPYIAANDDHFHLGATPEGVWAAYEKLRASLAAEPLQLGEEDEDVVYPTTLDLGLAGALYSGGAFQQAGEDLKALSEAVAARDAGVESGETMPPGEREALARRMAAARRASASGGLRPLSPDAFISTFLSIVCNDTPWVGDRASLVEASAASGAAHPFVGWYDLSNPCVFWDRPPVEVRTPTGDGVPPVLMVNSERDPATPIEGARAAADAFAGARLLTVTDEGDHGTYAIRENACVDGIVEAYLIDGVVPEGDLTCPGVPIPPPDPAPSAGDVLDLLDLLGVGTAAERTYVLAELAGPLTR
ncbi:MAG: alpha/beta fold hydrolase [Acidimicrobiia bacterium]